jgi:hypothetical protein
MHPLHDFTHLVMRVATNKLHNSGCAGEPSSYFFVKNIIHKCPHLRATLV